MGDPDLSPALIGQVVATGCADELEVVGYSGDEALEGGHAVGVNHRGTAIDVEHEAVQISQRGAEDNVRRNAAGEIHRAQRAQHQPGQSGGGIVSRLSNRGRAGQRQGVHGVVAQAQRRGGGGLDIAPLATGFVRRVSQINGGRVSVGRRLGAGGGGRGGPPLKLVVFRCRREIPAVAQAHLLIQRIGGEAHLQVAVVEFRHHLDDLHCWGIARRCEIGVFPVAKQERGIALALSRGGEGIAVAGAVGIRHLGQRGGSGEIGESRIGAHRVGAALRGILHKSLDARLQAVDRALPLGFDGSRLVHGQRFEGGHVGGREHIEVEVIFAGDFIVEFALEDQAALGAGQRIEEKAALQMRRKPLEIGFPLINACFQGAWEGGEQDIVQCCHFITGRIVQGHAGLRGATFGDRLLVEDLGAFLVADIRQAEFGQGEGLSDPQRRHRRRPGRRVAHGEGSAGDGIPLRDATGQRAQEGKLGAYSGLSGQTRDKEAVLHRIIPLHAEGRGTRGMRPAVNPLVALAVFEGEARIGCRRA